MNSLRPLLVLSALVNAALVVGLVYFLRPAAPRGVVAAPSLAGAAPVAVSPADTAAAVPVVVLVTNRFHWRELESTNYDVFVANLRAVGCPEKTVRDLVLADLRATFHARLRDESPALPFWTGGRARAQWQRQEQERERQLTAEFSALARRLLGVDWRPDDDTNDDLTEQALTRFIAGPLPEETFQKLVAVLKKFERVKSRLNDTAGGLVLPEDEQARQLARTQLQSELAATLTPAQLEEFFARVSGIPEGDGSLERDTLEVTSAEFRAICQVRSRHFDPLQKMLDLEEPSEEQQDVAETGFQAEVRALLGESRFADFERSQDDTFRSLYRVAAEDVGRAAVVKAFEVSRLARAEAERLAEDTSLTAADREQRRAQIAALTESELRRVLGEKAYQQCREQNLGLLPGGGK